MSFDALTDGQKALLKHAVALTEAQIDAAHAIAREKLSLTGRSQATDQAILAIAQVLSTNYHASVLKSQDR